MVDREEVDLLRRVRELVAASVADIVDVVVAVIVVGVGLGLALHARLVVSLRRGGLELARPAGELRQLLELALPDDRRRLEVRARLRDTTDDLVAERGDETRELLEARGELEVIDAGEVDGDEDGLRTGGAGA